MIINYLEIEYDGIQKKFEFDNKFNLIWSNKNSVGKSTMLRYLFYSLGYNVPGTKKIKFHKSKVTCSFKTEKGTFQARRVNDFINLKVNETDNYTFVLPEDEMQLHSIIWGTANIYILQNLLGAIYMDQDKGWTLLNRGIVIGSIRFNIEELIQGLANRDVSELQGKRQAIETELKKYRQLQNLIHYKEHLSKASKNIAFPDYPSELENKIQLLIFDKNELEINLKSLEEVKKENMNFTNFIEKMKLLVSDPETGITIPVTKETITHFSDNQTYIDTRYSMIKVKLATTNKELTKLNLELNASRNLLDIQSEIEKFDNQIANIDINPKRIEKIIDELTKKSKELKKEINNQIIVNNSIVTNLHNTISKYAKKLGVDDVIDPKTDYIFTSDLKSLSGAVLHKIVFSFKMAYIIEIQKVLDIKLPIVLDSPSGREVDQENIKETMNILMEDFSENQVILASIFTYKNLSPLKTIQIKNTLFEE
ncbi:hypothetical protein [Planococcus halotolerans]|uniref:Rad50/SbcC-type AAA domain-containing protein n=1 Tax=Planococcus halotolerans TaxID=2233542 RepID=A0A365KK53_9BACL|nr:hypothetical protein [Planococcus halotolerans]RAZ73511.1 hypothetical protein DP120_17425 [Planococcus halotolerans]